MNHPTPQAAFRPAAAALIAIAAASAALALAGQPGSIARVAGWFWLMLAPGFAAYRLFRGGDRVGAALSALLLSPVILSVSAILLILAGFTPHVVSMATVLAALLAVAVVTVRSGARMRVPATRELVALAALLLVVAVLTAWLPLTREWWRVRSDAWFHAAVVAQIRDFGLPAEDPYFIGMPLQYMWFYHVMVLTLADTLRLDAFRVMALVNVQALAGLGCAAYALAGVFRDGLAHRLTATATLLLGFNGAFWILLPVKGVKAMIGDVTGGDELARTFALTPFTYNTACGFMNIYYNQEFFLDKFMVATAFGFALAFMTAGWFAAVDYLATRRASSLLILALALIGMLGFHSLVGFVMLVGIFGGAALVYLLRRTPEPFPFRSFVVLLGVSLACFLLTTPYLYQVMHMKEREQVIPIDFSLGKTAGIFISSALVLFMALRRRVLFGDHSAAARMFLFGTVAITAFCLSIKLPGPNTYDKLGYFVFIPLSILAGFAIADSILSRRGRARVLSATAWVLLFFAPVNGLAIAACFNTPDLTAVTAPEARLAGWVREHTDREAVFIDDHDQVFLLVTGPRRYYWGWLAYAQQWGYPREEMARRYHVRRSLYAPAPLDAAVLESLAEVPEPLYVVVRPEHRAAGAAVVSSPVLFDLVYDDGDMALYRVNPAACRAAMSAAPPAGSLEELIRESGL